MVPIVRPVATTAYLVSSLQRQNYHRQPTLLFSRRSFLTSITSTAVVDSRRQRSFLSAAFASLVVTTATIHRTSSIYSITLTTRTDAYQSSSPISMMSMMSAAAVTAAGDDDDWTTSTMITTPPPTTTTGTGYLNAVDAAALDDELMSTPGFTLEQLMELAGLAVAEAVYQVIQQQQQQSAHTILIICGPGNNGGDGLVAARHLVLFGCTDLLIVYPALHKVKQSHYQNLIQQCRDFGIPITDQMPDDWSTRYSVVIDAIFGFSFRGEPRPPYDTILQQLKSFNGNQNITTVSVDIPSGWDVDGVENNVTGDCDLDNRFNPTVLISLTAPKRCAQQYNGRHFIGGRFLPPALAQRYNISMPPYPGVAQVMEITSISSSKDTDGQTTTSTKPTMNLDRSWEVEYANYLTEKEKEHHTKTQTHDQQQQQAMTWEEQYAAYCAEKEATIQHIEEEEHRKESDGL